MVKVDVYVDWCNKNFAASFGDMIPGGVVFTARTWSEVQKEAKDTLDFHVAGMLNDGDEVPAWLREGDYEFVYHPVSTAALLRCSED